MALNNLKHLQKYPSEFLEKLAQQTTHRLGCTRNLKKTVWKTARNRTTKFLEPFPEHPEVANKSDRTTIAIAGVDGAVELGVGRLVGRPWNLLVLQVVQTEIVVRTKIRAFEPSSFQSREEHHFLEGLYNHAFASSLSVCIQLLQRSAIYRMKGLISRQLSLTSRNPK